MCEVTVTDIVQQFSALKTNFIDAMDENRALREAVDLLSKRLQSKEDHRLRLISVIKERTDKYRSRVRFLQERNDQLESIVEEQRQSILEYSRRMIVLENTVAGKSDEIEKYLSTINRLTEEITSLHDKIKEQTNNNDSIINVSNQSFQTMNGTTLKLNHPLFCEDSKKPLKKRQQSKIKSEKKARWSNLNITFTERKASKDIINSGSNSESDLSSSREKRRKLYCVDEDATIDLCNEKD